MVNFPYEWKSLECDGKPETKKKKQTIDLKSFIGNGKLCVSEMFLNKTETMHNQSINLMVFLKHLSS